MDDLSYQDGIQEIDSFYDGHAPNSTNHEAETDNADLVTQQQGPGTLSATHFASSKYYNEDEFATLVNAVDEENAMAARDNNEDLGGDRAVAVPLTEPTKDFINGPAVEGLAASSPLDDNSATFPDSGTVIKTAAPVSLNSIPTVLHESNTAEQTPDSMPPKDDFATLSAQGVVDVTPDPAPLNDNLATWPEPAAHNLPSSGSKASLIEEMHQEEDQRPKRRVRDLPRASSPAVSVKKDPFDTPAEFGDVGSDGDAPRSTIGLLRSLKEVAAEEQPISRHNHPPKERNQQNGLKAENKANRDNDEPTPTLSIPSKRKHSLTPAGSSPTRNPNKEEVQRGETPTIASATGATRHDEDFKKQTTAKGPKRNSLKQNEIRNLLYGGGDQPALRKTRSQTEMAAASAPNAGKAAKARHQNKPY